MNLDPHAPIGIFDSGVGGTTIWRAIHELMPGENTLYLADSKYAPYGERSKDEILALSLKNTDFLLAQGCKIVVVACNTATTNAIGELRERYAVPFIGIEPAIKPAALKSQSGVVGVLATKGTLASSLFHKTAREHASGITIVVQEGTGLVPLIESGKLEDPQTEALLQSYLEPMLEKGMDHLVLGCTHFPYLEPLLQKLLPPHVVVVDSGAAVAKQTQTVLAAKNLLNTGVASPYHQFYGNADVEVLQYLVGNAPGISVAHKAF